MANVHQIADPPPPGGGRTPVGFAEDEFDLLEFVRKLWRRKGTIIGTTLTLMVLAVLFIFQLTPRYTAETLVMIDTRESNVVDVEAVISGLSPDAETIQSEIQVIRSRGLAAKTVEKLDLERNPEFNGALRPPGALAILLDPRRYIPPEWLAVITGAPTDIVFTEADQATSQLDSIIDGFLGGLEVTSVGRSRVIKIAYTSENPKTAARIANQIAEFYIVAQLEAKFEATQRASEWLGERLSNLREQVDEAERAVEEFRQQSGLIRGTETTLETQEISELNSQLVSERTKRAEAEARLRQVERLLASAGGNEAVGDVLRSPLIQSLREKQADLEREAAELAIEYGDKHPKMINIRAKIEDHRLQIGAETNRIVQRLRNEVGVARAREEALTGQLNALKQTIGANNTSEVKLRALEREAEASRTLLETFLARSKETASQESFQQADATILSPASIPKVPSFPNKRKILILFFFGAVALGLGLAYGAEMLDHGLRSVEQVESYLHASPLGLVPLLKGVGKIGRRPEDRILDKPASAYGESIRSLHTSLILSSSDAVPKVVLVTSSLPKEGKTTVSTSLAHMLALSGHKVIIVDCDLRHPTAHKSFGVPSTPGLVSLLLGKSPLDEVVQTGSRSGAHLIPAGAPLPNPSGVLGSAQMKKLLAELKGTYDLVILDSAPVLAVSDTRVLSRLADKCIFLVRWADTRRETALSGYRLIADAGADIVGVALTMVDVKKHAGYGYRDSGYYYGRIRKYYSG